MSKIYHKPQADSNLENVENSTSKNVENITKSKNGDNTTKSKNGDNTTKSKNGDNSAKSKKINKRTIWTIKITIITFFLSAVFRFISEITTSKYGIIIAMFLLLLLVVISIIFDGIGVAATSCELAPLLSMAARKVPGSQVAVLLVKNAEKVSNICADVIGDICGIVSGACSMAIVLKLVQQGDPNMLIINIAFSSVVAALTVGGKAFLKEIAVNNSKNMIMFVAKILSPFYKGK